MFHLRVHANNSRVGQLLKWDQNGRLTAQILPIERGPQSNLLQNDNWIRIPRQVASSTMESRISVHLRLWSENV